MDGRGVTPVPPSRAPWHLDEAAAAIAAGRIDLVTSDVFDTLVWRPVAKPRHLFHTMGQRLIDAGHLPSWVDARTFATGRRGAEQQARAAATLRWETPECTLEELWALLPDAWAVGMTPAEFATAGVALELAVEGEALRPHRHLVDVLNAASHNGVPVILVSDTYFSVAQLAGLLGGAGIDTRGWSIVTSSDRRMNKWGGLLAEVIAESGVGPDRVLHVGDNPSADVIAGQRIGAHVCHVDTAKADDTVTAARQPWVLASDALASDGGRSATVRAALVTAGSTGRDPSYQFGVAVAGPLMAGFAGWASLTAERLGASSLHCLLREGGRIAELIDVVRPQGPPRRLVHVSRWAVMRAAVLTGTPDELERSLARRQQLDAQHVAWAFDCSVDLARSIVGDRPVDPHRRADVYRAISQSDELRGAIVARSAELRVGLMAHLQQTMDLDGAAEQPLVLCDIGWGGTIQEGLTDVLRHEGFEREIIGLYALLSPSGERRAASGARLVGYLPLFGVDGGAVAAAAVVVRHPELLERINTPRLGTVLGYEIDGSPIARPDDHDPMSDSLLLAQRGVLDFCERLRSDVLADALFASEAASFWFDTPLVAQAALQSMSAVIEAPDARLATALGAWHHDDIAGTHAEPLANTSFARWAPYANAADAIDIPMNEVFWVPGAAAASNTTLSAQLHAGAAGVDVTKLCPPSTTGLARIAVFEPGSQLAKAQVELVPHTGAHGWMLLRLEADVDGLRSVRIDIGDRHLRCEIGDVELLLTTVGNQGVTVDDRIDGVAELADRSHWQLGRWTGLGSAEALTGGHLLIDDLRNGAEVRHVTVWFAVRTWPRHDDASSRRLAQRAQVDQLARRLSNGVRRRGGRAQT